MAPEVVRCEVSSLGGPALLDEDGGGGGGGDGDGRGEATAAAGSSPESTTWKKADIWSLACTVIEMSSGKPPWHTFSNPVTILFHIASSTEAPPLDEQLRGNADALTFMVRCVR